MSTLKHISRLFTKKIWRLALILVFGTILVFPLISTNAAKLNTSSTNKVYSQAGSPENGRVIANLWNWKFQDIAEECDYLALKGYYAVQVSPPHNHPANLVISNSDKRRVWWDLYQVVNYNVGNRLGSQTDFTNMVAACPNLKIYVDVIVNHMAGEDAWTCNNTLSECTLGYGNGYQNTANGYPSNTTYNALWNTLAFPSALYYNNSSQSNGSFGTSTYYKGIGENPNGDFHDCMDENNRIDDWNNVGEVQYCQLEGLRDLMTEDPVVQKTIAEYLSDLRAMGVDGFRVDAVKHIPADQMNAILNQTIDDTITPTIGNSYVYQEVLETLIKNDAGDVTGRGATGLRTVDYTYDGYPGNTSFGYAANPYAKNNGDAFEFSFGSALEDQFRGENSGDIQWLIGSTLFGEGWGLLPSDKAIPVVDNHDTERSYWYGSGEADHLDVLTYLDNQTYLMAYVFMLAWPYGDHVQVYSGYDWFNGSSSWRTDKELIGPSADANTSCANMTTYDTTGAYTASNKWVCQHHWTAIANMVGFRNAVYGSDVSVADVHDKWSSTQQIAFGVNHKGFVIINNTGNSFSNTFTTGLPAGTYCNVINGDLTTDQTDCTGTKITIVDNDGDGFGDATIDVPGNTAIAIHVGQSIIPPSAVTITNPDGCKSGSTCTFIATVPSGASLPLTFAWTASNQSAVTHQTVNSLEDSISFTWSDQTEQWVTVVVSNESGSATDTLNFTPTPLRTVLVTFNLYMQGVSPLTIVRMNSDYPDLNGLVLRYSNGKWTCPPVLLPKNWSGSIDYVYNYTRGVGPRAETETVNHTCTLFPEDDRVTCSVDWNR